MPRTLPHRHEETECCFKPLSVWVICNAAVDKTKTYFDDKYLSQGRTSSRKELPKMGVEVHTGHVRTFMTFIRYFFILIFQVIQI